MNNNGVYIILVVSIANIETFVITVVENYVDQHLFLHQLDVCLFRIALSIKLSFIHVDWILLYFSWFLTMSLHRNKYKLQLTG